ncbi:MAG: ABC transporter ATP-binding protein, partial [Bacteroidota bacterium]
RMRASVTVAEITTTIRRIAAERKTIIMASHILDEVEKVCSHVAIIKKGKLLATGEVGAILSKDKQVDISAENLPHLKTLLAIVPGVNLLEETNRHLTLSVAESVTAAELNRLAFQNGITLTHLVVRPKSLESEFLEITK